ncbi:MAG: trypsin-like peptidase domain-containing protein [Butyrivibrio sp.]|nr:trypsin-like peptidase domain-containing protein [Butyrivibrio sp.]MBR1643137.1 trypsin-like peptidase domain-containing protein [Butyrivibrio sp.]
MYEDNNNRPSVDNGSNANPTSNPYNYSGRSYNYAGGNSYSANNGSNPYSYNNQSYSYGQNSYNYNQNAQPTYGTYQYNSQAGGSVPPERPKKKKHTFAKIVAAICILALIVGGVGITYNTVVNKSGNFLGIGGNDTVAEVEQQDEEITPEDTGADPVTEDKAQAEPEKEIQTTTVTGASMAVVTDVTAVVEEVMPAMVMIHNNYTASASYFGYVQQEEATASGSGIIVGENDSELLIATNYHVIEGADSLEVIFNDDTTVEAVVKGTDSDMDLAVIAVMLDDIDDSTRDVIKIATLGDSTALKLGEPAIAIGNALGYGQSVTTGVISAVNRDVEISEGTTQTFIQTDAAINPGNSGGALLNLQGEVIGINSNKIGGDTIEGMGYAIPISVAQPIIDKLMNEVTRVKVSSEERGYIGISGVSVTTSVSEGYGIPLGVYVAEVTNGGGAQNAGIAKGDVIVEFDGQEITSMDDLQTRLQYYAAGTTVSVKVMRPSGQEYIEEEFSVTLGQAATTQGVDSNAGEEGGQGQYDGSQQPAMPGSKGGNAQQPGQSNGGGH